jgi:O-antigen ligase
MDRPLVGGGVASTQNRAVFQRYVPGQPPRAAHSIYFQVLGDQGPIGLGIFLAIGIAGWVNSGRIIRLGRRKPEFGWAVHLGRMMQVSFISYIVAGATLSMAYYTVFYVSVVMVSTVRAMLLRVEREAVRPQARASRRWLRPTAATAQ